MTEDGGKLLSFPKPETFVAIQAADEKLLSNLSDDQVRFVLPSLVRMIHCGSNKNTSDRVFKTFLNKTLKKIISFKDVESILLLLNVDFKAVLDDITNEQQLRRKTAGFESGSNANSESNNTTALLMEFENSNPTHRMRLILSEVLRISCLVIYYVFFSLDNKPFCYSVTLKLKSLYKKT